MPALLRRKSAARTPATAPQTLPAPAGAPPAEPAGAPPLEAQKAETPRHARRSASQRQAGARPQAARASWAWADVVVATVIAIAASIEAGANNAGPIRSVLGFAMLLFVPGYLLLQAFEVPAPKGMGRGWQALASMGISPAIVGLLALCTAIVQGGFRLDAIVLLVTIACLGFATAALVRRRSLAHETTKGAEARQPSAATAATAKSGLTRP